MLFARRCRDLRARAVVAAGLRCLRQPWRRRLRLLLRLRVESMRANLPAGLGLPGPVGRLRGHRRSELLRAGRGLAHGSSSSSSFGCVGRRFGGPRRARARRPWLHVAEGHRHGYGDKHRRSDWFFGGNLFVRRNEQRKLLRRDQRRVHWRPRRRLPSPGPGRRARSLRSERRLRVPFDVRCRSARESAVPAGV